MTQPSDNNSQITDARPSGILKNHPKPDDETIQKIASLLRRRTLEGPSLTEAEDSSLVSRAVSDSVVWRVSIDRQQPVRRRSTPDGDSGRSRCVKGAELFGDIDPKPAKSKAMNDS